MHCCSFGFVHSMVSDRFVHHIIPIIGGGGGGGRDGTVVRTLAFYQCGLGSIPGLGIMWVEFNARR